MEGRAHDGGRLRGLAGALGQALGRDDIARCALRAALALPGAVRAGIGLNRTGGRQLQFTSSEQPLVGGRLSWCLIDAYDEVPLNRAVRTGEDVFILTPEEMDAGYPTIAARQRQLGTGSMAALALATHDHVFGGLMVAFEDAREFDRDVRDLFAALAAQVAQALRRERLYESSLGSPEQLQRSLMMPSLPDLRGLRASAYYQPGGVNADVGGDWYDAFALRDGTAAVVVGDVMGKGVPAAMLMSQVRIAVRAYAGLDPAPSAVLARLDDYVSQLEVSDQFVTLAYGLVAPDRSRVSFGLAGHPAPLLVRPTGVPHPVEVEPGPALGLGVGPWPEVTLGLSPGETVLLYSNGLVERRSSDLDAGIRELVDSLASLPARRRKPKQLCAQARRLVSDGEGDDDVTLLAVGVPAAGAARAASTLLPQDTSAPSLARRFLRDTLRDWSVVDDTVDTAQLCVSELVTNAVIHAGTSSEITAELDDHVLVVEVRDGGAEGTLDLSVDPDIAASTISGRGLALVDALTSSWEVEQTQDGTIAWFELETEPARGGSPATCEGR